jgi:RHS repeat-associated protein
VSTTAFYVNGDGMYSDEHAANASGVSGKERDGESGLDNFGARYDSSNLGRFMSPDWSAKPQGVPYADFSDPQSLNLYAYARNNPLPHADVDGHCIPVCIWIAAGVAAGASIAYGLTRVVKKLKK